MQNLSKNTEKAKSFFASAGVKFATALLCIVVVCALAFAVFGKKEKSVTSVKPQRESVFDLVEVSGNVESSKDADLSFERSGTVNKINVKVGDKVKSGDVLATLSGAELYASVKEAEAGVSAALATLSQLEAVTSPAEQNFKKQTLDNAKLEYDNAESQTKDTLSSVNNKLKDIVDYKFSSFFVKDFSSYKMSFNSCDQSLQNQIEMQRTNFYNININNLDDAKKEATRVAGLIDSMQRLFSLPCSISDTALSDKRAVLSSVKIDMSSVNSEISSRVNIITTTKNALLRAERDYETSKTQDENRVGAQKAVVNQAYARLENARAQAAKSSLIAPFDGRVSEVNIELGELASQSKVSFKIISDSAYQIKSKISEIDISKVKVGNNATVTLDAFSGKEFSATVTSIDPASKNESGVPRYGVTLTFLENDDSVLQGMTANAKIISNIKESVLTVPPAYIEIKQNVSMVRIKKGEKEEDKIVKTGLRSAKGNIEIVEGLNGNETLVEIAKDGEVKR